MTGIAGVRIVGQAFLSFVKITLAAGLVMIVLVSLALTKGIGYDGSVNLTYAKHVDLRHWSVGHPAYGGIYCEGSLNMSFFPFFYPVSHMLGKARFSRDFAEVHNFSQIPSSEDLSPMLSNLASSELTLNLPYLVVVGFVIGFLIVTSIQSVNGKAAKTSSSEGQDGVADAGDWSE